MPRAPVKKLERGPLRWASSASNFLRATASRWANSAGMFLPSKDFRAVRTSGKAMVGMYSRKGMNEISSLSSALPCQGGRMMAFSGWFWTEPALVSMTITLERSRLRNEMS